MINRIAGYPDAEATAGERRDRSLWSGDWRQYVEPVEKLIADYPAAALATAFVLGVTLAWWIKRR